MSKVALPMVGIFDTALGRLVGISPEGATDVTTVATVETNLVTGGIVFSNGTSIPLAIGSAGVVTDSVSVSGSKLSAFKTPDEFTELSYDAIGRLIDADNAAPSIKIWQPNTDYVLGDKVLPSAALAGGNTISLKAFVCTIAGTSAATEPVWSTTELFDKTDNTITWSARNVYFIKPSTGSNANDGSQATPWASFAPIASGNLLSVAGRTFLMYRGESLTGSIALAGGNGTANLPCHIAAFGRGARPIVDARGTAAASFSFAGKTEIVLDGLSLISDYAGGPNVEPRQSTNCKILNCLLTGGKYGLDLSTFSGVTSGLVIDGNEITGTVSSAIYGNTTTHNNTGIKISNNKIHDNTSHGIYLLSGGTSGTPAAFAFNTTEVTRNTVYNNGGTGIWFGSNNDFVDAGRPLDALVTYNEVFDNGNIGIQLDALRTTTALTTSVISHNKVYRNCLASTTGGLHLDGCSDVLIEYNTVYDNRTNVESDGCGIYLDRNPYPDGRSCVGCHVRYNTVYGHQSWGYSGDSWFLKNPTSFNSNGPSSGIRILGTVACHVYDNVLYENGSGIWLEDAPINNSIYRNQVFDNVIGLGMRDIADRSNVIVNNRIKGNRYNTFQVEPANAGGNSVALTLRNYADTADLAANVAAQTQVTINAASALFTVGVNGTIAYGNGFIRYRATSTTKAKGICFKAITGGPALAGGAYSHIGHIDQTGGVDGNAIGSAVGSGTAYGSTGFDYGNGL